MTTPPVGADGTPAVTPLGPAPFAVTAPPELTLDAGRAGSVPFTITNLTGRPVKARLLPRGQSGTPDSWLSIVGPAEVPMGVGATVTAAVQVSVAVDAPAGQHALRLDVVAEDDTETVAGQSVAFAVAPPQLVKRRAPWLVIAIIAAVVLVIGGGVTFFLLTRDHPPVNASIPLINGAAEVGQTLTANPGVWNGDISGFEYVWLRCPPTGPDCLELIKGPQATYVLAAEDLANLIKVRVVPNNDVTAAAESRAVGPIASAPVAVPPLIGQPLSVARATVESLGLTIKVNGGQKRPRFCQMVESQDPTSGTVVPAGSTIVVSVFSIIDRRC